MKGEKEMKTCIRTTKTEPVLKDAELKVHSTADGEVCFSVEAEGDADRKVVLRPSFAVKLYRCLMGELESSMGTGTCCGMSAGYDDNSTTWAMEMWGGFGEVSFCLDADQSMALAWAVKKSVAEALQQNGRICARPVVDKPEKRDAWALVSRRVLTGDTAETVGTELIGRETRIFSSHTKAEDALREFMRPLVNAANTDAFWANEKRNVDDVLDEVLDKRERYARNGRPEIMFRYNGDAQSFVISMAKMEVV